MSQADRMEEKYTMMTQAPVERLVCKLAVPTIITMLISAMYNMADTYFVGSLGTSATASVGIVFSLMAIIQAMGFLFGHGAGNYISRQMGAKNFDEATRMATIAFFSAGIVGVILAVVGLLFLDPLALMLGATETILPYARDYMWYILLGAPFMTTSLVLNNLLRYQGSAFYGMIGMTTGAVLNCIGDPILIFVFDLKVSGAGISTMVSQIISCGLLLYGCTRGGNVRIVPAQFQPSLAAYREIFRGGFPSLCRQTLGSVASIATNHVAGGYGDAAIAAIAIVNRVTMMANSALLGFGQGFQPVCGFNYGAKLYNRVKRAYWFCIRVSTIVLSVTAVVVFLFAPQIVALFRADDAAVMEIGTLALRLQSLIYPFLGWIVVNNMMLQTTGHALQASILAIARQGVFLIGVLFLLTWRFGLLGLQMSQPIADFMTFLLAIPLGVSVLREMQEPSPPPENTGSDL